MIQIRRMTSTDCDAVSEIEAESFSMPWSRQAFLETVENEMYCFLIAEEQGEILGYCGVVFALDEGEIPNVCVRKEARGKGIGTRLMGELIEEARRRGIRTLFLEVRKSNVTAQRLYKKVLFCEDGIRKNFYDAPKEDAILMSRTL